VSFKSWQILLPLINVLTPPELRQDPKSARQAHQLVAFHLAMGIWIPVFAAMYLALDAPISAAILLLAGVLVAANLLLLWVTRSPRLCGHVEVLLAWSVYSALAFVTGGPNAPVIVWYASIPVLALLLTGTAGGILWTTATVLTIAAIFLAGHYGYEFADELTRTAWEFVRASGMICIVYCIYILVWILKSVETRANQAMEEAHHFLQLQASTDVLTGIANRRRFNQVLEQEWKRHERLGLPLSLVMIDIDWFKEFNDANGHLAGDICLKAVAQIINSAVCRSGDFAARYGGEEFVVILPNTNDEGAVRIADEIRKQLDSLRIHHASSPLGPFVTVSSGSANVVPARDESQLDFLQQADAALYAAKKNGRDQNVHFSSDLAAIA
jgi:diguanylate cyclase (GGDEF)-like protein